MVQEIYDFLNMLTLAMLGIDLSIFNIIVIAITYLFGFYFGKLTVNIGFWKALLALVLGSWIYTNFKDFHFVLIIAFFIGLLSHHRYKIYNIFSWASSLGDIIFAFRNKRAFDDIREQEEAFERQKEDLFKAAHILREERDKFNRERDEFRKEKAQNNNSNQQQKHYTQGAKEKTDPPPQNRLRAKYLKIIGLKTNKNYSDAQLKSAYRKAVKKAHPDTGGSHAEFVKVAEAYAWLSRNKK